MMNLTTKGAKNLMDMLDDRFDAVKATYEATFEEAYYDTASTDEDWAKVERLEAEMSRIKDVRKRVEAAYNEAWKMTARYSSLTKIFKKL